MRTAREAPPAHTEGAMLFPRGSTTESGPGHRAATFPRRSATSFGSKDLCRSQYFVTSAGSARCTIRGFEEGRPLTSKIVRTAISLVASAPRPYTVSVGNATSLPARSSRTATSKRASDGEEIGLVTCGSIRALAARCKIGRFRISSSRRPGLPSPNPLNQPSLER
jgi:hypothetical protein